ncbi:hypothetical protein JRO89_XS13G0046500 [Xanthoceras sorbifolium]|uniref:Kinesin-like protein n=1 Tax=Xanthoceras sorbifolium TaxID=99658 RepID=A0ABQ8H6I7_9ROSI|nr:hypothetical protein JRO89_XS13G0046500 [Xanthoceras sorbifolium]
MANNYRNGSSHRSSLTKTDRPLSVNSNAKAAVKSKSLHASGLRKSSPASLGSAAAAKDDAGVLGRVRVAVRLRSRNGEEMVADADFADCVELQPELKRLKLRKNNWDADTYEFDEVLTEFASQKRVYEIVAKPVIESVLDGYNGTIMAYGQTGTGKTYTLGRLGEEDKATRGIMVRAMEDILADVSLETDSVTISYLQLYMETIQDLLDPSNDNISIVEDPKTGDVSLPGATVVDIRDQRSFMELVRIGEANRFAANTKLNTTSSRSHAILMVHVKRSVEGKDIAHSGENGNGTHMVKALKPPTVRKGKLVVVDLAGSERIDKSGSEGHTLEEAKSINLSLSALGKCINALAEGSSHVPVRDSKLTRLLRDSFGGTARTSLVVTIGPSPRHRGETASTIMFGQRAMKVENMLKLKEEFDYKSLSRRLDIQLDKLIVENERQQKAFEDEIERITMEAQNRISEAERNYEDALEVSAWRQGWTPFEGKGGPRPPKYIKYYHDKQKNSILIQSVFLSLTTIYIFKILWILWGLSVTKSRKERLKYQKDYMESIKKLEEKWIMNQQQQGNCLGREISLWAYFYGGSMSSVVEELAEVKKMLLKENQLRKAAEEEVNNLKGQVAQWKRTEASGNTEILKLREMLEDETQQKNKLEGEIAILQRIFSVNEVEGQGPYFFGVVLYGWIEVKTLVLKASFHRGKAQRIRKRREGSIAKLFEQVGLHKILSLLEAEDADVQIHAVKVVANLAAEESNQAKIVEAGGLTSLLMLLRTSEDETIHRVAAGAIANLAMNETNQELIMVQGGISLLSMTAANAEDPQTLRMVAGAIANLCGNDKLQTKLRGEGGIKALLGMVRCGHPDVLAQVARGIANFAKCESRASTQGTKTGRSLLIEDGALTWIVQNANNEASPIRRHIELALCHLAQHEVNAKDMISGGALWELVRISQDCSREDIRTLAHRTLTSSPAFRVELRRLGL